MSSYDPRPQEGTDEQEQILCNNSVKLKNNLPPSLTQKTWLDLLLENFNKILTILIIIALIVILFIQSQTESGAKKLLNEQQRISKGESKNIDLPMPSKLPVQIEDNFKNQPKISNQNSNVWQLDKQLSYFTSEKQHKIAHQIQTIVNPKQMQKARDTYHRKREQVFQLKSKETNFQYIKLSKFNLNSTDLDVEQKQIRYQQESARLEKKYRLSQFNQEISMCVVVHAHPYTKQFPHEYVLNSIFNQQYKQYSIVFIADGYSAGELQPVKQFIKQKDNDKIVNLVWHAEKKGFLESNFNAIKSQCLRRKVVVLIEGNDQLLGSHVFKVLNTLYQRYNLNIVYGNFIEYHQFQNHLDLGFSEEYDDSIKADNRYKSVGQKFGSLKTFKTRLISYIEADDLKDPLGNYYKQAGDYALFYPLLQLSCGSIRYMPEYSYLYYEQQMGQKQIDARARNAKEIKSKKHYQCFRKYK